MLALIRARAPADVPTVNSTRDPLEGEQVRIADFPRPEFPAVAAYALAADYHSPALPTM